MKQVLSLLMAFTLLQVQTWALSGGPVYQPVSSPNQAGIYSGVMVAQSSKFGLFNSTFPEPPDTNAGNIGIFSVTVPISGAATGTTIFFVSGAVFIGTIDGIADPDKRTFDGIIQATGSFDIITTPQQVFVNPVTGAVTIVPAVTQTPSAQGQMKAKIIEATTTPQAGRQNTANGNAARMSGTAIVDAFVFVFGVSPVPLVQTKYSVSGFRQTTTPLP